MNCQNITLNNNEKRVLEYTDFSDLKIELMEGSNLVLKLANFKENSEINISGKVRKNAGISVVFADFSKNFTKVKSQIDLVGEGANCDWQLATLSNKKDSKGNLLPDADRITKFGKFLRKTSLDEILQFWDVFRGKLSLVGPRSPLPLEVKRYNERAAHRLDVKGGLVCYWQITKHRHDLTFKEWVDLDLKYIRTRSLWVDIKIIFKAFWFVLTDRTGE